MVIVITVYDDVLRTAYETKHRSMMHRSVRVPLCVRLCVHAD